MTVHIHIRKDMKSGNDFPSVGFTKSSVSNGQFTLIEQPRQNGLNSGP